ncbi:MAG TPA: hypothetical protein VNA32_05240 [Actinomycetota bacterium]|nr:hypothetical protein [Actinomycetota bacterium]
MSVAWRTSPEEDSVEYRKVIRPRRPKDTRMPLPESYWSRVGGCQDMTATGVCGSQVVTDFSKPMRCYFHVKVASGQIQRLGGSLFNTNGTVEVRVSAFKARKRAQHD